MTGKETSKPSAGEIETVRKNCKTELDHVGEANYDSTYTAKAFEDSYIERVWRVGVSMSGNPVDNSVNYIVTTLKWRKEVGAESVKNQSTKPSLREGLSTLETETQTVVSCSSLA